MYMRELTFRPRAEVNHRTIVRTAFRAISQTGKEPKSILKKERENFIDPPWINIKLF